MPRSYFPHEHGWINLLDDRICFTRSGNWQEAEATEERTSPATIGHASRVIIGALIVGTGGVFFGLAKAHQLSSSVSVPLAIGLGGVGCYALYKNLRRDFGPSFCVPFSKVRSIERNEKGFTIAFVNGVMKEDAITVQCGTDARDAVSDAIGATRRPA